MDLCVIQHFNKLICLSVNALKVSPIYGNRSQTLFPKAIQAYIEKGVHPGQRFGAVVDMACTTGKTFFFINTCETEKDFVEKKT